MNIYVYGIAYYYIYYLSDKAAGLKYIQALYNLLNVYRKINEKESEVN